MKKIYKIVNGYNIYIGQTIQELHVRYRGLQCAGITGKMDPIEEVADNQADERERYWIKFYREETILNVINKCAGGKRGGSFTLPSAAVDKIKLAVSGENNGMYNKNHSSETKSLMSNSQLGNKNRLGKYCFLGLNQ